MEFGRDKDGGENVMDNQGGNSRYKEVLKSGEMDELERKGSQYSEVPQVQGMQVVTQLKDWESIGKGAADV